jgi:ribosomal-protein-alanine N-acetyltransferase
MPIPLPIETERLLVRPFVPQTDSESMIAVYCDPQVMQYIPGGALAAESVRATLEEYAQAHEERGFSSWALIERASGRLIGDAGFGIFTPTGDIELGYTLARDAWGHGYATEAAKACLAAGLEHLGVPRIIAVVDVDNETSQRVAERIGMTRIETIEAHGRPHVLFHAGSLSFHSRIPPERWTALGAPLAFQLRFAFDHPT